MKNRITQIIKAMATLAVFSTLTTDILAQGSSVASMTIRATVVESASIQAVNDFRFTPATFNNQQFVSHTDQFAEFVLTGTPDAEISISVEADEHIDEDGNRVVFTPAIVGINGQSVSRQAVQMKSNGTSGQARASVWLEGKLESPAPDQDYIGRYLISAVYN